MSRRKRVKKSGWTRWSKRELIKLALFAGSAAVIYVVIFFAPYVCTTLGLIARSRFSMIYSFFPEVYHSIIRPRPVIFSTFLTVLYLLINIFVCYTFDRRDYRKALVFICTAIIGFNVLAAAVFFIVNMRFPGLLFIFSFVTAFASFALMALVIPITPKHHICSNCGYDLRGTPVSSVCPECGKTGTRLKDRAYGRHIEVSPEELNAAANEKIDDQSKAQSLIELERL